MRQLSGMTALLTGASRGLGPYIAGALAKEKVRLLLSARSQPALEAAAEPLRAAGAKVHTVPGDLSTSTGVEALAREAEGLGPIDIFVSCAGIAWMLPYHRLCTADILAEIQVNLAAPMLLTRLLLPGMLARGRGHIVSISSAAGEIGLPAEEIYCATKSGLTRFTLAVRAAYRDQGVTASAIMPGVIRGTGMVADFEAKSGYKTPNTIGGCAPEQVARAVVRALRRDLPEVLVNWPPLGVGLALMRLFPRIGEWCVRALGIYGAGTEAARTNLEAGGRFTGSHVAEMPAAIVGQSSGVE
jgi:short-subunit dehydrogenase